MHGFLHQTTPCLIKNTAVFRTVSLVSHIQPKTINTNASIFDKNINQIRTFQIAVETKIGFTLFLILCIVHILY